MAYTEYLPIYKGCYDLCLYLEQVVHHFSRYQKYTLGTDLRNGARRALRLVVRANVRLRKPSGLLQRRQLHSFQGFEFSRSCVQTNGNSWPTTD